MVRASISYMHHVSNQAVRDQTGATPFSELTKKRRRLGRLRFFGNIYLPDRMLNWTTTTYCSMCSIDNSLVILEDRGQEDVRDQWNPTCIRHASSNVQDRLAWPTVIETATLHYWACCCC